MLYSRAAACLQGPAFEEAAEAYLRPYLRKGIPSLFVDIRPLYK